MMKHYNFDAHGMTVNQIDNYLNRLLSFIPNEVFDICVIHGFNSGSKLRDYLRNSFQHQRVMQIDEFGKGRTLLILS